MVPSEALLLRRDFRDDPIGAPADQSEKALIGVMSFMETEPLSIKLSWRKNLEG